MKIAFFLLLLSLGAFAEELRILSWNTFLIPPPFNTSKQGPRTLEINEILPHLGQDIYFFQETFFNKRRRQILKALKTTHPYQMVAKKTFNPAQFQDAGLAVASKYPFIILGQVNFKNCVHSDCLAAKAAVLIELKLGDKKLQMVNTHLQAWNDPKAIEVRKTQLQDIKALLKKFETPGVQQILIGDLNIDGKLEDEYQSSLALMDMTSSALDGELDSSNGFSTEGCFKNPGGSSEGEWLDHLWVKNNQTQMRVIKKEIRPIYGILEGKHCPLSDHYALEAIIDL